MRKELPEQLDIDGLMWRLMKPGLYMRNHIGEITTPDGVVFEISGSLNGLSLYLETPYDHPNPEPGNKFKHRAMYVLSGGATLKSLVEVLHALPLVDSDDNT